MDLGATEWQAFRHVTLPALAPGIVAAALLALTVSFDDYVITSMVAGVDSETLPMVIYAMARRGASPVINAISALITVVFGAADSDLREAARSMNRRYFLPRARRAGRLHPRPAAAPQRLQLVGLRRARHHPEFRSASSACASATRTYESNEEMLAKVLTGNSGWDVVFPTHNRIQPMREYGLLAPLRHEWLPNLRQSRPAFPRAGLGPRARTGACPTCGTAPASSSTAALRPPPAAGPTCGTRGSKAASPCSTIPRTCSAPA